MTNRDPYRRNIGVSPLRPAKVYDALRIGAGVRNRDRNAQLRSVKPTSNPNLAHHRIDCLTWAGEADPDGLPARWVDQISCLCLAPDLV